MIPTRECHTSGFAKTSAKSRVDGIGHRHVRPLGLTMAADILLMQFRPMAKARGFLLRAFMMKRMFSIFAAGVLLFSSHLAFASGECDKYRTSYDRTYCFSKLFLESDRELNEVYTDLRKVIRDETKKQLTLVQREWIRYRDNSCQPQPGTINVDCNYRVNRERTEYLRDRLRECRAGTCRDDQIARKNW